MHRILFADDDEDLRRALALSLRNEGYDLEFAAGLQAAFELLATHHVDVVISDHLMPCMMGLAFLNLVHDRFPDTIRIMLTDHAEPEMAIKAIHEGELYRFLTKPCDPVELRVTLHLACERLKLERESRSLLAVVRSHPELPACIQAEARERGPRSN
ncbi:MAG TPA: response regulator [Anaeromyxobacteraceae bacterium]|nr:response regulator [Anaeromyxobacteraceae bacterium]